MLIHAHGAYHSGDISFLHSGTLLIPSSGVRCNQYCSLSSFDDAKREIYLYLAVECFIIMTDG